MSLRRQSCEICFRGRRKCDLTYPVCRRCQTRNKQCVYAYPPPDPNEAEARRSMAVARPNVNPGPAHPVEIEAEPPITIAWIFNLLRDSPRTFAAKGENVFINKILLLQRRADPLLTAFGICAAAASVNERNRPVLFRAVDAQMTDALLFAPPAEDEDLLAMDLARFQAAVLYQTIRLFHGGPEQRDISERQEYLMRAHALRLLARVFHAENGQTPDWETWLLHESVRRTVFVAFKLYTIYAVARHGTCTEMAALDMLPVSAAPAEAWSSKDSYDQWRASNNEAAIIGPIRDTTTASGFFEDLRLVRRVHLDSFQGVVLSATCRSVSFAPAVIA
ncbi:hypothetical protein QBC47DRAFT_4493 [Echria macrotheca]|uniref:Zn(2)-C6 fungal-type domain-containing protein n=1 Tax=Echria macrotheca TaxID=438768 RepID=A0AAJ0FEH5_9PEZI|nr:hypothetical protein QBC47DRAFT_4493 [Echria macrotheca]